VVSSPGADAAPLAAPPLRSLGRARLEAMVAAGREVAECHRVLAKGGLNIVGEVLREGGTFYELEHYPHDDVYDDDTHAQYYYHAHRGLPGEHGHFHTFLRRDGMPASARPRDWPHDAPWPEGDAALAHLIAISMDGYGMPIGLFAPNRWVVDDSWYAAADVIEMLPRFRVDHAFPSWPVNRWISAMVTLFGPSIETLLLERDRVIENWRRALPGEDVLERRDIDVLASMEISVDDALAAARHALEAASAETEEQT
jgi:hypothetical protein